MTTRREVLTGLGAYALTSGTATAQSYRDFAQGTRNVIADAPPIGRFGFILVDAESGHVIEERNADDLFIPASLAKIPTCFTAMNVHGPTLSFTTVLKTEGTIRGGVLTGDLHLVGGGDPGLDTTGLVILAQQLREAGITSIEGRFRYYTTALPRARWLDRRQPWQAPYNPSIGGLNLNYNRIRLRWSRRNGALQVQAAAASDGKVTAAPSVQVRIAQDGDDFIHSIINGRETWTLRDALLKGEGTRWLPVRHPGAYTASVFRQVCFEQGITLPAPEEAGGSPAGRVVAKLNSASVYDILRGMMRYSNNLTAEVLGASAALIEGKRPRSIGQAATLTAHRTVKHVGGIGGKYGWNGFALANHSGLSVLSQASPRQIAYILRAGQKKWGDGYRNLFNDSTMTSKRLGLPDGIAVPVHSIRGKTGSMHFVRGLAGFMTVNGRPMIYTFMANEDRSRAVLNEQFLPYADPMPIAAANWSNRTKRFQQNMLKDWLLRYSG